MIRTFTVKDEEGKAIGSFTVNDVDETAKAWMGLGTFWKHVPQKVRLVVNAGAPFSVGGFILEFVPVRHYGGIMTVIVIVGVDPKVFSLCQC